MSWRTVAVGFVGGFLLTALLEVPLEWYLPGGFIEGWPSIDSGLALALSMGGLFLMVACGAFAARLDRAASRRQAASAGAVAGLTAALVADALIGAAAAAVWGSRPILAHGLRPAASEMEWFSLYWDSLLGLYNWTYASLWIAAFLGLGAGAVGGAVAGGRSSGEDRLQVVWPAVFLASLIACALSVGALIASEVITTLVWIAEDGDAASVAIPCARLGSTTTLLVATSFGVFLVLQLLSLRALKAMPQTTATDHATWRFLSLAIGAVSLVPSVIVASAYTDIGGPQAVSLSSGCVLPPLSRALFVGAIASLALGFVILARSVGVEPPFDLKPIATPPGRKRFFSTFGVGAVLSGLVVWLLLFSVVFSAISLSDSIFDALDPSNPAPLVTSDTGPIWELVFDHYWTHRVVAPMSILLGVLFAVLVADAVWVVEWRVQRRLDRPSAARPWRMIATLIAYSLLAILLAIGFAAAIYGMWWVSGQGIPGDEWLPWHWTHILVRPELAPLLTLSLVILAVHPRVRRLTVFQRPGGLRFAKQAGTASLTLLIGAVIIGISMLGIRGLIAVSCRSTSSSIAAWEDRNANGVLDVGEPPLSYVAVTWQFPLATSPQIAALTGTDGRTSHSYPACAWDQLSISAFTPAGYEPTTPITQSVASPGAEVQLGFRQTTAAAPVVGPSWLRLFQMDGIVFDSLNYSEDKTLEVDLGESSSAAAADLGTHFRALLSQEAVALPVGGYDIVFGEKGRQWSACYPSTQCVLAGGRTQPETSSPRVDGADWSSHLVSANNADVRFPDSIAFALALDSGDDPIEGVQLEYGHNGQVCATDVNIAVPEFQSGSTKVDTEWLWDMKKTFSLPPGALIWWRWRITTQSEEIVTPTQDLVWLDQDHDWASLSADGIALHSSEEGTSRAKPLIDAALEARSRLQEDLGAEETPDFQLFVYNTPEALQEATFFQPDWMGGQADPNFGVVILSASADEMTWAINTVEHETAHIVVHSIAGSCYTTLPLWLDEGLATRAEAEIDPYYAEVLSQAIESDELLSVRSLTDGFSEEEDQAYLSYAQSFSIVDYLLSTYGREKLLDLLGMYRDGYRSDRALQEVYGFDMDGLDAEWRVSIGAVPGSASPPLPSPTLMPTYAPVSSSILPATPTPQR